MTKYEQAGDRYYSKEHKIDSIISVSDSGKVVYKTADGKERLFSLSN